MRCILWAIRRPYSAIASMVLLTLTVALGLSRLELQTDGNTLIPPRDPAILFDGKVREWFGIRDLLIILLESSHPQGIYNPETLRRVEQISELVAAMEEIGPEHVRSLATERRDRVYPGTLKFRPLLDPFPDTPRLMEHLRVDIEAIHVLKGTLVSADGSATAILVGVPKSAKGFDRTALFRRLVTEVKRFQTPTEHIMVVGAPAAEALLGSHMLEDLAILIPMTMALMAIILGLRLRRVWGVVLGLVEVGACMLFTFGLMGWLDTPLYLTTAGLPVVLIAMGLADEIHIFFHYQDHIRRSATGEPTAKVVERSMREMLSPVVLTSLTTSIGFFSFLASAIEPIRTFGVFAAAGILFCLLWTVVVIPAALTLLQTKRMHAPERRRGGVSSMLGAISVLTRSPRWTLPAVALLSLTLGLGVRELYVQDSWIEGFAPESSFRRQTEVVNDKLFGTHILQVYLETAGNGGEMPSGDGRKGWLLDPALLKEIGAFEDYLRDQNGVGGVLGPHSQLSTVAYLWLGRKEGTRRIPDDPLRVARVLRFFEVVSGKHRRREVINDQLDRALVTVFLKGGDYQNTQKLIGAIRDYEKRFTSQSVRLELAGDAAVSQAMIPAVVRSQLSSLLIAVTALLTLCVLFGSLELGLLALLPVSTSVLWTFGAMGWLDIPLGVATSMFCAIALGVGVDYPIHFLACFRRAQQAGHPQPVQRALAESGPAIMTDMLAITCSFGLLLVSQVPPNARLGFLVAIALTAACFLTLAGLGAWLTWKPPRQAASLTR